MDTRPAQRLDARAFEEADAIAEHYGREMNVGLVDQAARRALAGDVGAEHLQVLAVRSGKSRLHRLGYVAAQERDARIGRASSGWCVRTKMGPLHAPP
jgi:hypothetical protein